MDADYSVYGRCASDHFFVYVGGLNGAFTDFAYVEGTEPEYCTSGRAFVSGSERLSGNWYHLPGFFADVDDFYTPTPFPTFAFSTDVPTATTTITPKPTRAPGPTPTPKS